MTNPDPAEARREAGPPLKTTMAEVGDIGREINAIDRAYRDFTTAVEGPCMEDYPNDAEAYRALAMTTEKLRVATGALLDRVLRSALSGVSRPPEEK